VQPGFFLFLVDTGLCVAEAYGLTQGEVNFYLNRLTVLGKRYYKDLVGATTALREYLALREQEFPHARGKI